MSRESLKTIAEKDKWTWDEFCRAHAYNTGRDPRHHEEDTMSMEKRAVVNTEKEKTAHKKIGKQLTKPLPPKKVQPKKKDVK